MTQHKRGKRYIETEKETEIYGAREGERKHRREISRDMVARRERGGIEREG